MSQVTLYAGDNSKLFGTTAVDRSGRTTDIDVYADSQTQANKRVQDSLKDYNFKEAPEVQVVDIPEDEV